ncbi:hypothetical protein ON010_g15293 [Phytophthora cinnamomi]|nr:hypothetical protein ON010_g15293 [Phytophthora cinnamomi]
MGERAAAVDLPPTETPAGQTPAAMPVMRHSSSGASSADAVTRAQVKKALATPRNAAALLTDWTERTLIDPAGHSTAHPSDDAIANYAPKPSANPADHAAVSEFVLQRQAITRQTWAKNKDSFHTGDRVLLSAEGIRSSAVTNLGANKLAPRFIGPSRS